MLPILSFDKLIYQIQNNGLLFTLPTHTKRCIPSSPQENLFQQHLKAKSASAVNQTQRLEKGDMRQAKEGKAKWGIHRPAVRLRVEGSDYALLLI